jgi:hypothetical protein
VADPLFTVQLQVRGGYVAVDPARSALKLDAEQVGVYESCGISQEALRAELIAYLDRLLHQRGKALELAVVPMPSDAGDAARRASAQAALRDLAHKDDGTAKLLDLNASWVEAATRIAGWVVAHVQDRPAVMTGQGNLGDRVYAPLVADPTFADGPLLPTQPDLEASDPEAQQGRVQFSVAPPFTAAAAKLRPSTNPGEWKDRRGEISEAVLGPFVCRLWHRDRIVGQVQDFLEVRGISVKPYRTKRDVKDAGLKQLSETPEPTDMAGVAPERPSFARKELGGRVLLAADPLIDSVFVEVDPNTQWPTLRRVLYLLLPSSDWERVMHEPATNLCTMEAVWKPPTGNPPKRPAVVRLALADQSGELSMGRTYLTRRTLAERLQRLDRVGFTASMAFPSHDERAQRKGVSLRIEPAGEETSATAQGGAGPDLLACPGTQPTSDTTPAPLSTKQQADVVQPPAGRSPQPADKPRRTQLTLGVEHAAGKPLRASVGASHQGMTGDDTFSVELGQQEQSSGRLQYNRDFLGFDTFNRRVQLGVNAFSDFNPDRAALGTDVDERRQGVDLRATVDLWRDRAGSFAQLDIGATSNQVELSGSEKQKSRVTLLEVGLFHARALDGSPSSPRHEFGVWLAQGRAGDPARTFSKATLDASYSRFVGAFTRWDLRAHARHAGAAAPLTERPTFGGDETVRGFRADAGVGRTTWALQNEYWMPLSALAGENESLARTLRRSTALALFVDVGRITGPVGLPSGNKAGLGAGLRLTLSDAFVLRFDWARAAGRDANAAARSGYVYLTVTSRRVL